MPKRQTLEELLVAQHNVITRKQARKYMTGSALAWRLGKGKRWQVILPGVCGAFTGTATEHQRMIAALLYAGEDSFITGSTACRWHWLRKVRDCGHVHIAVIGRKLENVGFVRFQRTARVANCVGFKGLRIAPIARCVVDATLTMTNLDEVRALLTEAVMRKGLNVQDLVAEAALTPTRGSRLLRQAIHEVVTGARSAAEAKNVQLTRRSTVLPKLHYNCSLMGPKGFIAKPDAYAEESGVAQEIDSVEFHIYPGPWKETMARRARMVSAGIRVLEAPPSRLDDDPTGVLAEFESTHLIGLQSGPPPGVWVLCRKDCPLRGRTRAHESRSGHALT
jgi:hypothetical protein